MSNKETSNHAHHGNKHGEHAHEPIVAAVFLTMALDSLNLGALRIDVAL